MIFDCLSPSRRLAWGARRAAWRNTNRREDHELQCNHPSDGRCLVPWGPGRLRGREGRGAGSQGRGVSRGGLGPDGPGLRDGPGQGPRGRPGQDRTHRGTGAPRPGGHLRRRVGGERPASGAAGGTERRIPGRRGAGVGRARGRGGHGGAGADARLRRGTDHFARAALLGREHPLRLPRARA